MYKAIKKIAALAPNVCLLELAILVEVNRTPHCSQIDIANRLEISKQTANFHIHRLSLGQRERMGLDLISIRRNPMIDKRVTFLTLTSTGEQLIELLGLNNTPARCDKTIDFISENKPTQPPKSLFDNKDVNP